MCEFFDSPLLVHIGSSCCVGDSQPLCRFISCLSRMLAVDELNIYSVRTQRVDMIVRFAYAYLYVQHAAPLLMVSSNGSALVRFALGGSR